MYRARQQCFHFIISNACRERLKSQSVPQEQCSSQSRVCAFALFSPLKCGLGTRLQPVSKVHLLARPKCQRQTGSQRGWHFDIMEAPSSDFSRLCTYESFKEIWPYYSFGPEQQDIIRPEFSRLKGKVNFHISKQVFLPEESQCCVCLLTARKVNMQQIQNKYAFMKFELYSIAKALLREWFMVSVWVMVPRALCCSACKRNIELQFLLKTRRKKKT